MAVAKLRTVTPLSGKAGSLQEIVAEVIVGQKLNRNAKLDSPRETE